MASGMDPVPENSGINFQQPMTAPPIPHYIYGAFYPGQNYCFDGQAGGFLDKHGVLWFFPNKMTQWASGEGTGRRRRVSDLVDVYKLGTRAEIGDAVWASPAEEHTYMASGILKGLDDDGTATVAIDNSFKVQDWSEGQEVTINMAWVHKQVRLDSPEGQAFYNGFVAKDLAVAERRRLEVSEWLAFVGTLADEGEPYSLASQLDAGLKFFHSFRRPSGHYGGKLWFWNSQIECDQTANVGFGLVCMTMMVERKLIERQEGLELARQSVRCLSGVDKIPLDDGGEWCFERSANGFFLDYPRADGRKNESFGVYSTTDTAICCAGIMFAAKYFDDTELSDLVKQVVTGVTWSDALKPLEPGKDAEYAMIIQPDGTYSTPNVCFNEYYLLAFCGALVERQFLESPGKADAWFQEVYAEPDVGAYWQYNPWGNGYYPFCSFTTQFCFYLSGHFAGNPGYQEMMQNSAELDVLMWKNTLAGLQDNDWARDEARCWGCSAGSDPSLGYKMTSIYDNPDLVYSAPAVAGFLPCLPEAGPLLEKMCSQNDACKYSVPSGDSILWRASIKKPEWRALTVEGVDFAPYFLGLAYQVLGKEFFERCRPNF